MSTELLSLGERELGESKIDLILEVAQELRREIKRTDTIEHEVVLLRYAMDKEIWLTPDNCRTIQKAVAAKVRQLMKGSEDKGLRRRYFSAIWNAVKDRFRIHNYHVIARKQFNDAVLFVEEWYPLVKIK